MGSWDECRQQTQDHGQHDPAMATKVGPRHLTSMKYTYIKIDKSSSRKGNEDERQVLVLENLEYE